MKKEINRINPCCAKFDGAYAISVWSEGIIISDVLSFFMMHVLELIQMDRSSLSGFACMSY